LDWSLTACSSATTKEQKLQLDLPQSKTNDQLLKAYPTTFHTIHHTAPTQPSTPPVTTLAASFLPEMETQTPNPPSSTTREPLVSSSGSHERGRNKGKQFDSVTEAHKIEIETVLLLMDTFAVEDGFIHDLSGVIDGMPRSYLIKQCRDKTHSRRPGLCPSVIQRISHKQVKSTLTTCSLFFKLSNQVRYKNRFKNIFLGSRWKIVR